MIFKYTKSHLKFSSKISNCIQPACYSATNNFNPTSSQPQLQTPNLFLSHISNLIYIKLGCSNYVLWKYQIITSILWSYSLLDFIDGTQLNPEKYLLDKSGTTLKGKNPLYQQRNARDQELQTLMNSPSLSPLAREARYKDHLARLIYQERFHVKSGYIRL